MNIEHFKRYNLVIIGLVVVLIFFSVWNCNRVQDLENALENAFLMYVVDLKSAFERQGFNEYFVASLYKFAAIAKIYDNARWGDTAEILMKFSKETEFNKLDSENFDVICSFLERLNPVRFDFSIPSEVEGHEFNEYIISRFH